MKYLLDTNVFSQAHYEHYHPHIFPGFWDWLSHLHKEGRICSLQMVKQELIDEDELLLKWMEKELPESFF